MLKSLAWLALVFWFAMVMVVAFEKNKTDTPETDRTFLGFMAVASVPHLFGAATLAILSTGLLQIAMFLFALLALRSMLSISVKYLKARKQQPRAKTPV